MQALLFAVAFTTFATWDIFSSFIAWRRGRSGPVGLVIAVVVGGFFSCGAWHYFLEG